MEIKALLLILLCSQLCIGKSLLDDPCGGWEPYKDEKCLKIFNQNLLSYADAESICENEDGALLPSINSPEKQQFMENLLTSQNVVDNVWIGLKYVNGSYAWVDGTEVNFANWASGNPSNDSTNCVEIETAENNVFGYWADVPCKKKNLVICEKAQLWSLSKLQSTVINLIQNPPVPIGFIYVQLPKEKPPQDVWAGLNWEDVTSDYAGLFFRAEGGKSASFGEVQNESSPRLATVTNNGGSFCMNTISVPADGTASERIVNYPYYGTSHTDVYCLSFQLSTEEVCPRNTAIKIWKRVS